MTRPQNSAQPTVEQARAVLAQHDAAQAEKAAKHRAAEAAERKRRAERERVWARWWLDGGGANRARTDAHAATRHARTALDNAIRDTELGQALAGYVHAVEVSRRTIASLSDRAAHALGRPLSTVVASDKLPPTGAAAVLADAVLRVAEDMAEAEAQANREALAELLAAPDDTADMIRDLRARETETAKRDAPPTVAEVKARARVEVLTADGRTILRDVDTGQEWEARGDTAVPLVARKRDNDGSAT